MTASRSSPSRPLIPVAISARHVHLSRQTAEILFGAEHSLKAVRALSQPGQYVAQETVSLRGPKGSIQGVKVLGPLRGQDQIEISRSDAFSLGLDPPIRLSGDVTNSAPITLIGPNGSVQLASGAICAQRHIHMDPKTAHALNLVHGQHVSVQVHSPLRSLLFEEVVVRVDPHYSLEMHLDTDEANASGLKERCFGELVPNPVES